MLNHKRIVPKRAAGARRPLGGWQLTLPNDVNNNLNDIIISVYIKANVIDDRGVASTIPVVNRAVLVRVGMLAIGMVWMVVTIAVSVPIPIARCSSR